MSDILFNGISLVALVVGVTQVIKQAGVDTKVMKWVALLVAFIVFAGSKAVESLPEFKIWYEILLTGLYGISATGLYDVAKGFLQPSGTEPPK